MSEKKPKGHKSAKPGKTVPKAAKKAVSKSSSPGTARSLKSPSDDRRKTKDQLVQELARLRRRNARLEKKIKEINVAEAEASLIYNSISDYITVVSTDYRIISYNRAVEKQFGKDLKGKVCHMAYQGRDEICPGCAVRRAMESKRAEFSFQPATEVSRPVEIYAYPILDDKGGVTAVVEHGMDVSEKLELMETLRESGEKYHMLFNSGNDAVFVHNVGKDGFPGKFIEVNDIACKLYGYSREEFMDMTPADINDPLNASDPIPVVEKLFTERHVLFETVDMTSDGRSMPVEISSHLFEFRGESLIISMVRDITERRQTENRLRESEEKYRMIFNKSPLGILHFAANGDVTDCNDHFASIIGAPKEKVIDFNLLRQLKDPRMKNAISEVIAANYGHYEGDYMSVVGGKVTPVKADFAPIKSDDASVLGGIGIFEDITERRKSEKKIRDSLKEKEVLLMEVHHRVKNNMAIIYALLRLQARQIEDSDVRRLFSESQNRIKSMALVHEKLYQARDFANISFREYIRELVAYLLRALEKSAEAVRLGLDMDQASLNIDAMIPCGLIVNELVTNSLQHGFEGIGSPEINMSFSMDDGRASFVYGDNGRGIPGHIEFPDSGTLGLQIIEMLTTQLKGTVTLERTSGTKFSFNFELPSARKKNGNK
jgi:PAS domain S-box-containing protein